MFPTKIHLLTHIRGFTLLVYQDCHGYQCDAIANNGTVYRYRQTFYLAESAKTKGRQWIEQLRGRTRDRF